MGWLCISTKMGWLCISTKMGYTAVLFISKDTCSHCEMLNKKRNNHFGKIHQIYLHSAELLLSLKYIVTFVVLVIVAVVFSFTLFS